MEKTLIRFQQMIGLLVFILLSSCGCPDKVTPTLDYIITPREPKFGDTVEFTDLSNAYKVNMHIILDSIRSVFFRDVPSSVSFTQDGSLGKIGYDTIFNTSRLEWNYPSKGGNFDYDLTNRFRTRFVINKKVSKLIVSRIATNYPNCSGLPFQTVDNIPVEVRKYDTIYVK